MKLAPSALPEVLVIEPRLFADERGHFFESWNQRAYAEAGIPGPFVQDNCSRSAKGVLRGLHYQIQCAQGKLVRVESGEIFDVVVDIRRSSATFGRWVSFRLQAAEPKLLWVPAGFAHGFLVLSDWADVMYKTTDYYAPRHERTIRWDDPQLAIRWPLEGMPRLSAKDARGSSLAEAETYP